MAPHRDVVSDPFTASFIRIKAAQLCRRTNFSRSDREDLKQGMLMHLLAKRHLFDPLRGTLEAFVATVVTSWVRMELRSRSRPRRCSGAPVLSLEQTIVETDDGLCPLRAVVSGADLDRRTGAHFRSSIECIEMTEVSRHAMSQLAPDEAELIRLVAERGIVGAARELARRRGGKPSRSSVNRAVACLRKRFENSGLRNH